MNPRTQNTSIRLNLIRILSESPNGLTLEDLKKVSGIQSESELKKQLGTLYMVGIYPYSPLDFMEVEFDGSRVRLLFPTIAKKSIALSSREWILLRDSLLFELEHTDRNSREQQAILACIEKIKKIVPFNELETLSEIKSRIRNSIHESKRMEFRYTSRDNWEGEPRTVEPWYLIEGNVSYLLGYCLSRKAPRIFRLDSIMEPKKSNESFPTPKKETIQGYLSDFEKFLKDSEKHPETATLYHSRESWYYLNQVFRLETTGTTKTIGGREFLQSKCRIREPNWFLENLTGFLPDVILTEPESLKTLLVSKLQTARNALITQ